MIPDSFEETLDYLYGLQRLGMKFGLDNITRVLEANGNPQNSLSIVHIAGSNGKGSTAAHLESFLIEAGYTVGLYSSPHFVSFTERIRVDRKKIEESDVVRITRNILDAMPELVSNDDAEQAPVTFFELTTVLALVYFAEKGVDLVILEAGLGGRLDATNVCNPILSMITTVSLEHQEFLGNTLVQITGEKAGIVKPGKPVVCGVRQPEARKIVRDVCEEKRAPLYQAGEHFSIRRYKDGSFSYSGIDRSFKRLRTSMRGQHQAGNAAVAVAGAEALQSLGFAISDEAIRKGLDNVRWRGRQEYLEMPQRVLLDGAHNAAAMTTLCRSLKNEYTYRRLLVLMGIMREKSHRRMIGSIAPLADEIVFCRPKMDRSQAPEVLKKEADRRGVRSEIIEDAASGFRSLLERAGENDLVCVTGSLFTVGEVMALLEKNGLH